MDTLKPVTDTFKPRTLWQVLKDNRGEVNPPADPPPQDPPADPPPADPPQDPPADPPPEAKWSDTLPEDLKSNPVVQKYKTQEDMVKGHLNLQKLVGNDKVPIPKDENDTVAIEAMNRALGVPEEAAGYELENPTPPEGMESVTFGMDQFKALAHKHSLTPAQAKGIQEDYVGMLTQAHEVIQKSFQDQVNEAKGELKKEWGLAYDANIKTAQLVMNKFAGSEEAFEHINAKIGADPVAMKWLAKLGAQFKEGSLGDTPPGGSFTKTPAAAKAEYDKIMSDNNDPYWAGVRNQQKIPESVRRERVAYVESLLAMQLAGNA